MIDFGGSSHVTRRGWRVGGALAAGAAGAFLARAVLAWAAEPSPAEPSLAAAPPAAAPPCDLPRVKPRAGRLPGLMCGNYRGRTVSLAGGPALSIAATVTAVAAAASQRRMHLAAAAAIVGGFAGAVGRYDDVVSSRQGQRVKGLAGHFGALRGGVVTSGVVKLVGVCGAGLAAATLQPGAGGAGGAGTGRRVAEVLAGAGVIAGTANLLNLLDLRPGRALKTGLAIGGPLVFGPGGALVAGTLGAALAVLPDDLREHVMLGDCGANTLGALVGLGIFARTGLREQVAIVAVLAALTVASERVSFSRVIEATPPLRQLDRLGRRGDGDAPPD